jgi:ribose-phosphate pyrophosphokinase
VTEKALVFDDILDTGETLVECCKGLRNAGAKQVRVAVTHGLFTGTAWRALWGLGVDQILTTDSVQPIRINDPRVRVLSCSALLAESCGLKEMKHHVEAHAS